MFTRRTPKPAGPAHGSTSAWVTVSGQLLGLMEHQSRVSGPAAAVTSDLSVSLVTAVPRNWKYLLRFLFHQTLCGISSQRLPPERHSGPRTEVFCPPAQPPTPGRPRQKQCSRGRGCGSGRGKAGEGRGLATLGRWGSAPGLEIGRLSSSLSLLFPSFLNIPTSPQFPCHEQDFQKRMAVGKCK